MATKKFFDGTRLLETELPDVPLPEVLGLSPGQHAFDPAVNPMGVDPSLLTVDVAQLPNLRPTDGAIRSTKFPDRPPGSGEGSGLGAPSGLPVRDPWENNPDRIGVQAAERHTGEIGSALTPANAEAADATAAKYADAWAADRPSGRAWQLPQGDVGEVLAQPVPEGEFVTNNTLVGGQGDDTIQTGETTKVDFTDKEAFPNKEALRDFIATNRQEGDEEPHANATREELEARAAEVSERKNLV